MAENTSSRHTPTIRYHRGLADPISSSPHPQHKSQGSQLPIHTYLTFLRPASRVLKSLYCPTLPSTTTPPSNSQAKMRFQTITVAAALLMAGVWAAPSPGTFDTQKLQLKHSF